MQHPGEIKGTFSVLNTIKTGDKCQSCACAAWFKKDIVLSGEIEGTFSVINTIKTGDKCQSCACAAWFKKDIVLFNHNSLPKILVITHISLLEINCKKFTFVQNKHFFCMFFLKHKNIKVMDT